MPHLPKIRGWVNSGKGVDPRRSCTEEFYRKDGIMYRRGEMKGRNQFVRNIQRILPEQLREGVMEKVTSGDNKGSVSTVETRSPDSQTYKVYSGGNQIELLGHIVGDGLIKPQEGKVGSTTSKRRFPRSLFYICLSLTKRLF